MGGGMRYCTQCGTAAEAEQAFCNHCGSQLRPPAEPQAPAQPPTADSGLDPGPAEPEPPAPAVNWPDQDLETGAATATWVSPASEDARAPLPDASWQSSTPADAGTGLASGRPSPPGGTRQARPPADLPPPGRRRGGRVGLVITIAAVILAIGGGVAAWRLIGHKTTRHTAGPHVSAGTVRPRSNSTSAATPPPSASQASPASSALNTGSGAIAIAPALNKQANSPQVAAFLQSYFRAINTRDYSQFSSLFELRLRPTLQQFESGYRSTHDSDAVLTNISSTPVGVAAAVSFTSHQQPTDSPTGTPCTSWDITLYLKPHDSTYRITSPPTGYHAHYQAC
jgi:hypothetical protein